ncbi:MAG: hypothetical protein ACI9G9_001257 [Psychromonas sp.]|jgi:hypothetical protein
MHIIATMLLNGNQILPIESTDYWNEFSLSDKLESFGVYSQIFLLISFILLIIAKYRNPRSFRVVALLFFRSGKIENSVKEIWPMMGVASVMLVLNFLVCTVHSLFLIFRDFTNLSNFQSTITAILTALVFFFLAFFAMLFTNLISGNRLILKTPLKVSWVLPQFIGLVLLLSNILWVLNPSFNSFLVWVLISFLVLLSFLRFSRASLFLLRNGTEWYYILLYLCTLEIMPLVLLTAFLVEWVN